MSAYLDERYFDWLYSLVCSSRPKHNDPTYRNLLDILYTTEFVWLVPNDDNRIEDGRDLRYLFCQELEIRFSQVDTYWMDLGCSMLELIIGLARRLEFETDLSVKHWFWELLENLELNHLDDSVRFHRQDVVNVLERVIWRTYNYNGGGGLFPLRYPERDQRKVELWYQLSAYILERLD